MSSAIDVINKLYSSVSWSVSSTVSQLSGVLPGNPVTREFEATCHIASAGPGLLWKVYKGYKKSTKQEAAIFLFEKKQLEKWNKNDRDTILDSMRKGITQLTKIRHPKVLTVQHPLEESRESLAFATEPVFASMANILGQSFNMPQPPPAHLADFKFFEVEIKYGLMHLGEGLAFLHNDVKLLHRNLCPESIIVNQQGAWKIFGFDFCLHNQSPPNSQPSWTFDGYNQTLPAVVQPSLDYLAPEYSLTQSHSSASDMFSLGMLVFTLHSPTKQPYTACHDYTQFKTRSQQLKQLQDGKLLGIPEGLRQFTKMMLNTTPEIRPDAHQFVKIPYFEDLGVKTLNYLDSLFQWDNVQKSQFYRGLPDSLKHLPQRVQIQKVLPCLVQDLIQPVMVPFILPSVLNIAEHCNGQQFAAHVLPHLKPVMKLLEPVQILLIFLQRMPLLLKLTPPEDIQQDVLPMLYRGLDSDAVQIQELCLSVLPTFAGLLNHASIKNAVLPRIKKLCLGTQTLSVRVNCLICLGKLLDHLDKWLVLDEVLPFLAQIPSREPAVLMGILGIYKLAMTHKKLGITKEVMATKILPFLMPLCIENGLTIAQFNALVALVKQMFQMVETEHRTKLEQLNSVQQGQKPIEMTPTSSAPSLASSKSNTDLDGLFSGLGMDSFLEPKLNGTVKPPDVSSPTDSLSIEEKQRLAQSQSSAKLMQNTSLLAPSPQKPPADPLGFAPLSQPPSAWPRPLLPPNNPVQSPVSPQFQQATASFGALSPPSPMGQFNQWTPGKIAEKSSMDLSPFDSLVMPGGMGATAARKLPMNQLGSTRQPLVQPPPPAQPTKTLSKDDIADFLS